MLPTVWAGDTNGWPVSAVGSVRWGSKPQWIEPLEFTGPSPELVDATH